MYLGITELLSAQNAMKPKNFGHPQNPSLPILFVASSVHSHLLHSTVGMHDVHDPVAAGKALALVVGEAFAADHHEDVFLRTSQQGCLLRYYGSAED